MDMLIDPGFREFVFGLASALLTAAGVAFGIVKWFSARVEKANEQRFAAIETARNEGVAHWDRRFTAIERIAGEQVEKMRKDHDERMDAIETRVLALEARIHATPTHQDLARVHEKLGKVAEDTSRMRGELGEVSGNLRLLINQVTKKGIG